MHERTNETQLVVIGAGPGGHAAAFLAADLGMQVALVDPEVNPGGVCLYRGCIPSKALLHVAKLVSESRQAAEWGIRYPEPKIDLEKLRDWKNSVVAKLTGGLGVLSKQRSVRYIQGTAGFLDSQTLSIKLRAGGEERLPFKHAIIATGSRPAMLPGVPQDSERVLDSTSALDLSSVPKTLLVVGGGYIGLELGTVYATLGTKVSVVEMLDGLMPGADRDLVNILAKRLEKEFESIRLKTKVVEMKATDKGIRVKFEGAAGPAEQTYDKVLISVGRKPNSAIPGLERTKVMVGNGGYIQVNPQRQTADPYLYAIGDVAGEPLLAHKATHEGRAAVEAIAGRKVAFEPRAIPAVIFTDPEIAWCGLTETEAQAQNRQVKVAKFPWAASGRALTLGRSDGVTKLIVDPASDLVLGVGICGVGAGDLIAEGVLAIEMAALAADIELTIHPHPTLSETVMQAAEVFYGTSTDFYRPKKK